MPMGACGMAKFECLWHPLGIHGDLSLLSQGDMPLKFIYLFMKCHALQNML